MSRSGYTDDYDDPCGRLFSPPSPEIDALLTWALQLQGVPADLDAWAEELSRDIAGVAD